MQTTHFQDWPTLKRRLDQLRADRDVMFRGQGSAVWRLSTRLARFIRDHDVPEDEALFREARALDAFRTHPERPKHFASTKTDRVSCMVALQHYGCPTRLMDWTWSPYIAAYFAAVEVTSQASLFAIDLTAYQRALAQNLPLDDYDHGVLRYIPDRVFDRLVSDPAMWPVPYWPEPLGAREATQQSLFLLEPSLSRDTQAFLSEVAGQWCFRLTFPVSMRGTLLSDLRAMNIDGYHLFLDAVGVALEARDRLFGHPQMGDRIERIKLPH